MNFFENHNFDHLAYENEFLEREKILTISSPKRNFLCTEEF